MLIGIVKKNAIHDVDFALQRLRAETVSAERAVYEAAIVRFRPIMMTTMAALVGTLPIVFGTGMGADSRRPLGVCVPVVAAVAAIDALHHARDLRVPRQIRRTLRARPEPELLLAEK